MTAPNHADLARALGNVEGSLTAMKDSIERIEAAVESLRKDTNARLSLLEKKESERRGAMATLAAVAGAVGALLTKLPAILAAAMGH